MISLARACTEAHRGRRDESGVQDDEFLAYLATAAGVLIASAIDDAIDARLAWILVAAVGIGYMLSRGLAKSGTNRREDLDTI